MRSDYLSKALLIFFLALLFWREYQYSKTRKELAASEAAHIERNAAVGRLAKEYYDRFKDITDRTTPAVPERVYVKANCVPTAGDTGLGDGASGGRLELSRRTVESVGAVADKFQRELDKCSVKLEFLQQAVRQ